MTPDEHLQGLDHAAGDIRRAIDAAFETLCADIQAGAPAREAVQAAFDSFSGEFKEVLAAGLSERIQGHIGALDLNDYPIGKVSLSRRLYQQARETSAVARAIIQAEVGGWQDARRLALNLYEGYGFRAKEALPVKVPLPKYLREALGEDKATLAAWRKAGSPALRQILADPVAGPACARRMAKMRASVLRTPALKAAYLETIDALEKGVGFERLKKKLKVAWHERNRYFAGRITQTELHRAWTDNRAKEIVADAEIQAVIIRMSSTHPRPDICDLFAKQDAYGLGPGVYPKDKAPKPPFHPFCRCVAHAIHTYPKTPPSAREGAAREFLRTLPAGEAAQVMGSRGRLQEVLEGKEALAVYNRRIKAEYRVRGMGAAAKDFASMKTLAAPAKTAPFTDFVRYGEKRLAMLPDPQKEPQRFFDELLSSLAKEVGISTPCLVASRGAGAKLVQAASSRFPNSWTLASDRFGPFTARAKANGRGYYSAGRAHLEVRSGDIANAVHEFAHRLQHVLPEMDDMFQKLHRRRTAHEPLERLRDITTLNYGRDEVARKDKYIDPYVGREYAWSKGREALEVMTMSFQAVLGYDPQNDKSVKLFKRLHSEDNELFYFVIGLLYGWKP